MNNPIKIIVIACALLMSVASVEAATIYVPADYADVQSAINASVNGDIIEIAAGTYTPSATLNTNGKAITLRGAVNKDGTPATVLDGAGNKLVLRCSTGEGIATRFENLVIRNGFGSTGGGMRCTSASPTLTNCTFAANTASTYGGGMYCTSSNPILNSCRFEANTAPTAGGMYCSSSSPTLINCTLVANSAVYFGGGMYCVNDSNVTLTHCTFEANIAVSGGGGMHCGDSIPTLTECIFCGNYAPLSPHISGATWVDAGGNCFTSSCTDTDGDGWPDKCGQVGDGIHEVPREFATIEAAFVACGNGDTIVVAAGTYFPATTLNPFGKRLTLRGATQSDGAPATVIDGGGNKQVLHCAGGEGSETKFENLVIRNGFHSNGGGMYCASSSPTLTNCVFEENTTVATGGGMYCFSSSPTLANCAFRSNKSADGGGMHCHSSSNPTLTDCVFEANTATHFGGGIYCYDSSRPILTRCAFEGNTADASGGGMCCDSLSNATLTDCTFEANTAITSGGGISSFYSSIPTLAGCVLCGNTAPTGPQLTGSWTDGGENCITSSCSDTDGDGSPDKCGQVGDGIHYVPSEYATIEAAIAACGNGDTIVVAAGTYAPAATLNPLGKQFTLRGAVDKNGAPTTIVDGAGNKRVLQCDTSEGAATRFENLVIRNGSATTGGGMYCSYSSPTLANCTFESSTATYGGGLACSYSNPTLTQCTFEANSAASGGGGMNCSYSHPTLIDCTFTGNTTGGQGGAMSCANSNPTLSNCAFATNTATRGGAMHCANSNPTLTDCTFEANTASIFGGGLYCANNSNLTLTRCTIEANTASYDGGGMYCTSSSPTLTDCTFAVNTATVSGGGIYCSSASSPTLTNCVFCGNTAPSRPHLRGSTWVDGGGNCFTFSCSDADGDGWPDKCGQVGDGMHHVPSEYATIEAAIAACGDGDTIVVAAGTYTPAATLNPFGKRFTLRGAVSADGTPTTILDGAGNKRLLYCTTGEGPDTRFENLVIRNGFAYSGGGMQCDYSSSPTLTNCTFEANTATNHGGGLYCYDDSSPTLIRCTIKANSAINGGGLACIYSCNPTLTNCTFQGNTAANGGAISCYFSNPILTNCTLETGAAAKGGGMHLSESSPILTNCILKANTAGVSGGGLYCNAATSAPTLAHCLLCGNLAPSSPQIYGTTWIDAGENCISTQCITCDGDGDGVMDAFDNCPAIANADQMDCDSNGIGDVCQIAVDPSLDCDNSSTLDSCDITNGEADIDNDGTLDSCEYLYGDFDLNGIIDAPDLAFLLSIWELPNQPIGDITGDGLVNAADLAALLSRWGRVP